MKLRTASLMTLALAVVVAVIAMIGQLPGKYAAPEDPAASSAPDAAETPGPTTAPGKPSPPESAAPGPEAGGNGDGQTREGPAPLRPTPAPVIPLISSPPPATASASGALVAGFPSTVISLVPRSTVILSSVASEGDRVQVGLSAMSTIAPTDVLAHYSAVLAELGLVAHSTPALGGSTAAAFTRGQNTVTVTASSVGGGSRYTVFGVFLAGS